MRIPTEIFEAVQNTHSTCLFVLILALNSHLRWHEYHGMFGIDLLRSTIACPFLEWQLLFDVIFIVIYL